MTRVKICGISDLDSALAAAEAGANAIGLIFAKSRRQVTPERAREIAGAVSPFVAKVGVFVDEDRRRVAELVEGCGLDTVQLHGWETPQYCDGFQVPVVKAIRVRDAASLDGLNSYRVSAFLLDTFDPETMGGTGRPFDWTLATDAARSYRVILSGGLNAGNVIEAIERVRPYAVDVSSGVENNGRKDHARIRDFIRRVREWDYEGSRQKAESSRLTRDR